MISTLPIVLRHPHILIIGAGNVALEKIEVLQRNRISFDVIAQEIHPQLDTLPIKKKSFEVSDALPYHIIIDATGDKNVAEKLIALKLEQNYLLNVVDNPELCDFYFAALLELGELKVSVSSSGASPTIAQEVRNKIARLLPKNITTLIKTKAKQRQEGFIDKEKSREEILTLLGKIYLVGCGTGGADLLTRKAYQVILEADVVMVDHLISPEIKALIPKGTQQIDVGKQKGHHKFKQEEINALLIQYAKMGKSVARLKSGDPYLFGRGAEEAKMALEHKIACEVIPGVTSAISAAGSAGIPVTARGYAANLSIVSGHLRGNRLNTDWLELLLIKNHTTVVLMGLSRAGKIAAQAIEMGVDKDMPTAIVSHATRPTQSVITTTIEHLQESAKNAQSPAILVFGEVVNLSHILPHYIPHLNEDN
jgi:uroporphyrin-III C-methyltransferase / precorrin-2 dehydrogenase / sirohydrochlorin ferrochelatase